MKRFIFILATMLFGVCCFAQDGPHELTFLNTRIVKGVSRDELYSRAEKWEKYQEKKDHDIDHHINNSKQRNIEYYYVAKDCPNFGVSPLFGGTRTGMSFVIKIYCRDKSYTSEISHIDVWYNPDLGVLYEENGRLSEKVYNRKQLKMGEKIVDYLSDYTAKIFDEIYEYMSGK